MLTADTALAIFERPTGEPDALKGASPVRKGAVGKVPVMQGSCREADSLLGNSLAAYSTSLLPATRKTGWNRRSSPQWLNFWRNVG